MANTSTVGRTVTVFGNQRTIMGTLTMTDGAASVVASGLDVINGGSVTPKTATTSLEGVIFNSTSNGDIKLGTAPSGNTFNYVVYGT